MKQKDFVILIILHYFKRFSESCMKEGVFLVAFFFSIFRKLFEKGRFVGGVIFFNFTLFCWKKLPIVFIAPWYFCCRTFIFSIVVLTYVHVLFLRIIYQYANILANTLYLIKYKVLYQVKLKNVLKKSKFRTIIRWLKNMSAYNGWFECSMQLLHNWIRYTKLV